MPTTRPWIETAAGCIPDPVRRLRFLKAVAPRSKIAWNGRPRRSRAGGATVLVLALAAALAALTRPGVAPPPVAAQPPPDPPPTAGPPVWLVERNPTSEIYSNGLRVDTAFATPSRPRDAQPAGIVFHSTESELAPFAAEHNDELKRIGESLIEYIRRRRSYHYLIDRFGRAFRIVDESDSANHAGHSVWADERRRYVDLNGSFLGVAFEGRGASMTAAQARAGAMLVEILRARYGIDARNCITHAQVSVNLSNRRIGYHVDWAAGFPFAALGLPDNYAIDLPAIWAFGFEADKAYRAAAGESLRRGIDAAERRRAYSANAPGASGRKKNTMPRIK